jgi:hypothetical protein
MVSIRQSYGSIWGSRAAHSLIGDASDELTLATITGVIAAIATAAAGMQPPVLFPVRLSGRQPLLTFTGRRW